MRWCVVWVCLGCCMGPGCTFVRPAVVHRYTFDYNTERQLAWQHETYDERPLKPGRIRLMSWAYNATTSPFAIGPAGPTTVAMGPESATEPSPVAPEMNSPHGREPDAPLPQPVPPQRLPPAPVLPGRTTRDELLRSAPPDWQLPEDEESLRPAPAPPSAPAETAMPPIAQTSGSEGASGQAANRPAALHPAAISSAGALRPSVAKPTKLPPGGFLFSNQ